MWNSRLLIAAVTACAIFAAGSAMYAHNKGLQSEMLKLQTSWASERAQLASARAEEEMKARQRERSLQATVDRLRQEKANEARRLAAEYAAALDSVRDRADRPAAGAGGVPEAADHRDPGAACAGGQLYRQDAEFLIGEAARADRLRLALAQCQGAYNSAREQTNPD